MENNTTIVTMENRPDMIADMTTATVSYCSMQAQTPEERKALFTAMNNPSKRLEECINMTLNIKDVYAETIQFVNELDGTFENGVRLVLIDTNGESYGCCAMGVYSSIKKLIQVFGEPTWENGIEVIPYTVPSRRISNGKVLTLKLA